MANQIRYEDACAYKSFLGIGGTLFTYLVGANYRRIGSESNTTNGTISPSPGERGYGILQDIPRLADGYDKDSPATVFYAAGGNKEPWPWYKNAREAWFNGINRNVTDTNYRLCQGANGLLTVADPIAQSFFVVGRTITISKIDVFFKTKDTTLPVFLELRKNVNGVPGPEVIPFSSSLVYPETIRVSEDSSIPTTFLMNGLVHLEEGEYSIVIRSDSINYEVWVSTVNEIDVQRKVKISSQNQLGSFFKSQNLSTWTADQLTDLKFTLYNALFDTSSTGYPVFSLHNSHFNSLQLENNPLEFYPGSKNIRVYAPGHGMKSGDNVIIDAKTFTNSNFVDNVTTISGTYKVRAADSDTFIISGLASANASVINRPTRTGGTGIQITNSHNILFDTVFPEVAYYAPAGSNEFGIGGGQCLLKVMDADSRTYSVSWVPANKEFTFETTKAILNPYANNYVNLMINSPGYSALQNYETFNLALPLVSSTPFSSPLIDTKKLKLNLIRTVSDNVTFAGAHLIPEDYITLAANSTTTSVTRLNNLNSIARIFFTNASDVSNAMTVTTGGYVTISTPNNVGQYRIVSTNTDSTNANIIISKIDTGSANVFDYTPNILANSTIYVTYGSRFIDETAPRNGTAKSKYITKEIKFASPSTSIFIKLDACKPTNTNLRLFYRTKTLNDSRNINDIEFSEFPIVNIPTSSNDNQYYEIQTQQDNLQPFESLQIKIVFHKDEYAGKPPKVKNLRVISLA